ncbi:MAG TPA: hypothetical protein VH369_22695 [Bryobacteraceae bacterium]
MAKLTTLHLGPEEDTSSHFAIAAGGVGRDRLQYAFLVLLAVNVFLVAGGASFALLYFSR